MDFNEGYELSHHNHYWCKSWQIHILYGDEVCPTTSDYNNKAPCIKGSHHCNVWVVNMELDITHPFEHQQIFPHGIGFGPKDEIETPRFQGLIVALTLLRNELEWHNFKV